MLCLFPRAINQSERRAYRRLLTCSVTLSLLIGLALNDGAVYAIEMVEKTIMHDGRERFYTIARPTSYCPGNPAIVILHGGSLSMRRILEETSAPSRWLSLAETHGLMLLLPNGWNVTEMSGGTDAQSWNDLRPDVGNPISNEDDAGFIMAMLEFEGPALGFDTDAVFVTGSSNGGMMAYRMLIEHSSRFAGGAAFIANLPEIDVPDPDHARPLMFVNGDDDPLIPWGGGTVGFAGAPVRSTLATLAYWRRVNGVEVGAGGVSILPDIDPTDGARLLRYAFGPEATDASDRTNGTESMPPPRVVLYRMDRGGHAMPVLPGDPQETLPPAIGTRCRDARGVDLAWSFIQQHLPQAERVCDGCDVGDMNLDGAVDMADVVPFVDVLLAPIAASDVDRCLADTDGNGIVDGRDLPRFTAKF